VGQLHTHQIHVETEEDLVTVQIGGEGSVPGGFAKLFNRVVDTQAWARLSDAARAAYIPMVRFADHRNQFRVQIGQAGLMKYSGLSRSSIKRAIKDLLASRLIVLIEQGGVTPDGRNESNLYQLMVPVESRRDEAANPSRGAAGFAHDMHPPLAETPRPRATATRVGSAADPQGAPARTVTRFSAEPPVGSGPDRPSVTSRTASPVTGTHRGGVAAGPQLRSISESQDSSRGPSRAASSAITSDSPATDAVALLVECGVERPVARQLAATYPLQRITDVIETMQYRRSRGKCGNPGGFIRDALVKQWQTPQSVLDARAKAEAKARAEAAASVARQSERAAVAGVDAEQRKVDQLIDALDDDELEMLALEVLKKYDGNTAVLSVLTRKPARDCRLMKMEIAALLGRR
jgi:hypothetical protein